MSVLLSGNNQKGGPPWVTRQNRETVDKLTHKSQFFPTKEENKPQRTSISILQLGLSLPSQGPSLPSVCGVTQTPLNNSLTL